MDITWLEDFLSLARTLNFTRAASERNVTQSAFSRRIRSLERWAGQPLVDRSSYPVQLLPAGVALLPVAHDIIGALERTRMRLHKDADACQRFQTVAATHAISVNVLPSIRRRLEEGMPGVRIRVKSDNFDACCNFLDQGNCDFLFCYRHPDVPGGPAEIRFGRIDVATDVLIPVVVPDHNGRPLWSLTGRARSAIPHLSYTHESYLGSLVHHVVQGRGSRLNPVHLDAFADALKGLTLQGLGVAWLPNQSVQGELAQGLLVPAGGARWTTQLIVSVYADVGTLDAVGMAIWDHLAREYPPHSLNRVTH